MSLIGLSGEALRRHPGVLRTRRCLQDVEQVETDRLLDLHSAALCPVSPDIPHPDIAAVPEIVHVLLLSGEQPREPLTHDPVHCPFRTAGEFYSRSCLRRVVNYVLVEIDRTFRQRFNREGYLTKVLFI